MAEQNDSNNENVSENVPPEMLVAAKEIALNSLPIISKQKYTAVYNEFKKWRSTRNTKSFAEPVFLIYFNELATKYAPPSLWSKYSMLRTTIKSYDNIDISTYPQLIGLLKRKNVGYKPKKSSVFTTTDVSKFLKEAPDAEYLVTKVCIQVHIYLFMYTGTSCLKT
ncbi:hypothetical protein ALC57_03781 [Trachymyrmex cornetzi]|uniref:Uncharacterized protein n=1 Tax=Trachymyrmex cornetzi TaxID=471704 RepID=A0A151J4R4_9HYME|nr:hypothetical protein ALC57_09952 [Trachymyrmex cornetzi]KYN21012.1 hypothetical protein ALC57_06920 [Trachymyrmex cornetzi]KYN26740.1 hypothetical protein ALC57_03781 [Trachymyrmex cornetzi]